MTATNSLSTYAQQVRTLQAHGDTDPKPRKKILYDMTEMITKISKDDYIIIGIDANESLQEKNSDINKFMTTNGLKDIYSSITKDTSEFPTHINGSKRIDMLLASSNILPYITRTGILKFHEGLVF